MRSPAQKTEILRRAVPKSRKPSGRRPTRESFHLSPDDLLRIFNVSPVSIWIEDFSLIKERIDQLKRNGVRDFKGYFRRHPNEVISLAQAVRILDVNEATLGIYEARTKKALQRGLGLVFDKESYDIFREEIVTLAEGKTEFSSPAVTKSLKGNRRHALLKLAVVPGYEKSLACVVVSLVDLTELEESRKELRESEEKYRTIVEFAPDTLLLIDADTGIILEANRKAESLFGLPVDQITGMHVSQILPAGEAERHRKLVRDHAEDDCWALSDFVVFRKNGERASVSVRSCLVGIQGRGCVVMVFQETDKRPEETREPAGSRGTGWDRESRRNDLERLSRREKEVIRLISAGLTNRQIAKRLFLSIKTVETHRARIMDRLGFHKTADIVRFAIFSGLCEEVPPKR